MADELNRMTDFTAQDIVDNINEVRIARGTYDSLAERLAAIEARLPSTETEES